MSPRKARADAVRNRAAVLAAADRLFTESPEGTAVSMDAIATAAGVGKGTLFRGFGDRSGLIRAVYEARTERLREAIATGPAPLGPGSPPRQRVRAVMAAVVRVKLENSPLMRVLESATSGDSGALVDTEPYRWVHAVLAETIAETSTSLDPSWTAHVLLSMVRADLLDHLTSDRRASEDRIVSDVDDVVERLLDR
ncbi:TetR/AcrR family transcriptional regulator [Nocardiopsis ansamitocini]|uniref:TetR family transcriptional regulator n=1 Tax=Nocardiopsis ansamitocini TaxID=1670832 RepID=A0A9W6P998_9ACTN|nr:TetR/AcrR family transcriptional regulator [Nocardiopsis ansamitocini]GLU49964.1 TetR family transcriptional regulator [Nocardiopsis ansamitocini]